VAARRGAGEKVKTKRQHWLPFFVIAPILSEINVLRDICRGDIFLYIFYFINVPLTIKHPPQSSFNLINNRLIPTLSLHFLPEKHHSGKIDEQPYLFNA
jgi:hypothetical protein